jgi:thiosulfate/3-mercaptopyruvate sulfurtransferase
MMDGLNEDPLVSTAWLQEHLREVRVLDATWTMPADGRDPSAEFAARHVPGAQFFDIDAVADHTTTLPHMLPTPEVFAQAAGTLGVGDDTWVVAYDNNSLIASARLWWTLRVFGHERVKVLDGGLAKWVAEARPLEHGPVTPPAPATFSPRYRAELVRDLQEVRDGGEPVLDARSGERFRGEAPEPRAGLRGGHMPGALSLPFSTIQADGRLKPADALAEVFRDAGAPEQGPLVATCGSGVTASGLALALARLGRWDAAVYDGSWSEWGAHADTPVVTGP